MQVVVQVTSTVGEILQLLPHQQVSDSLHDRHRHHPVHNHAAPMQFLAKLPVWGLFNDNTSFQVSCHFQKILKIRNLCELGVI